MATPAALNAAATPVSQSSIPEYSVGERVLCFHGPLVYEAKILGIKDFPEASHATGITGLQYLVHYKGWKQTWDEYVPPPRLLKMNEANLAHQKALQAQHASSSQGGTGSSSTAAKAHKSGASGVGGTGASARSAVRKDGRGTKRGRDEDDSARKPEMKLNLPELLKVQLVDDWQAVTKTQQIVPLPRTPSINDILREFSDYILSTKPPNLKDPSLLLPTIISGLQCYFDKSLGMNLLYRFERQQYSEVRKKYWTGQHVVAGTEKEMSFIYGAEHLLRMLVSLPGMIAHSSLDPDSVALIRDYVNELLQYMLQEKDRLFLKEYENPGAAYLNVSRS